MKKLFSLVALAGMFTLMSFSFKAEELYIADCEAVACEISSQYDGWVAEYAYDMVTDMCLGGAFDY